MEALQQTNNHHNERSTMPNNNNSSNNNNNEIKHRSNGSAAHHPPTRDSNRLSSSPVSLIRSTSEFDSSLIDLTDTASNHSTVTKSFKPEDDRSSSSTNGRQPGKSRMKQLLERRHAHKQNKWMLGARRIRLLREAKEKMKQSEYEAARLSSRLDILNLFVDHALVDESFLGKKELNPWRFKNPNLDRKYNFVNNLVTTQEMLVIVEDAKNRNRQKKEEEQHLQNAEEVEDRVNANGNELNTEREHEDTGEQSKSDRRHNAKKEQEVDKDSDIHGEETKNGKLREEKTKSSRSTSLTSNSIIYAFGSTHNKKTCLYCGSSQCKGQMNRTRMNMKGKNTSSIGQRISDVRGIYFHQKEDWQSKYNKKIQDRIKTLDKEMNDKVVTSRMSISRSNVKVD